MHCNTSKCKELLKEAIQQSFHNSYDFFRHKSRKAKEACCHHFGALEKLNGLSVYAASVSELTVIQRFLKRCYKRRYTSIYDFLEKSDRRLF